MASCPIRHNVHYSNIFAVYVSRPFRPHHINFNHCTPFLVDGLVEHLREVLNLAFKSFLRRDLFSSPLCTMSGVVAAWRRQGALNLGIYVNGGNIFYFPGTNQNCGYCIVHVIFVSCFFIYTPRPIYSFCCRSNFYFY